MSLPYSVVAVVLLVAGCASSNITRSGTAYSFDAAAILAESYLNRADLSNALWGIRILRLDNREVLFEQNPVTSFVPASNTKLYTTAAALDQLGPDYRFLTHVRATGPVESGVLNGDLVIRGTGDPSFGGRFNNGDVTATFREWASRLKGLGITEIDGNIVGDDDAFDDLPLGYGWSWDDETYWYSAEVGALTFNDNCIDLTITGTQPGQPAVVSWEPLNTSYVTVENQSTTLPSGDESDEEYFRARASNHFTVKSAVAAGSTVRESLSISNPTVFFVHTLRSVLVQEGITVNGYAVDIDDLANKPSPSVYSELFVHESPPLSELAAVVNKRSHNLYAEQILRVMGGDHVIDSDTTSAEAGLAEAAITWAAAGIDTSRIQLVDGSGLSRYNFVTAEMTSKLLVYMWESASTGARDAFLESLPIGGVDGTIGGRFRADDMRGRVRAKTGTVSNVSSLSGYVTTDSGIPLAFSIIGNNFTVETDSIRAIQDRIVTAFAHVSK